MTVCLLELLHKQMYKVCGCEKPKVHVEESSLLQQKTLLQKCLAFLFSSLVFTAVTLLHHSVTLQNARLMASLGQICNLAHPHWGECGAWYRHLEEMLYFTAFVPPMLKECSRKSEYVGATTDSIGNNVLGFFLYITVHYSLWKIFVYTCKIENEHYTGTLSFMLLI